MAKNNRCGCGRNSNNSYGCLNCLGGCGRWNNYPYYDGPCPNRDGFYDCCDGYDVEKGSYDGRRCCRRENCGIFSAMLPMAVSANGIIPLVNNNCVSSVKGLPVNSGLITVEEEGTYLATYTVRVPEGAEVNSTFSLNVNDASQATAVTETGGTGPNSFTGQAIFDVRDRTTVALRSSEAINITDTSQQPLVTLSLVKL